MSIIDPERQKYCPAIFENPDSARPNLKEDVRQFILAETDKFAVFGTIAGIFIIGSILTKRYTNISDIDVTLILHAKENEFNLARRLAGTMADSLELPGTKHPVNFFVRDELVPSLADDIYDVESDAWIKKSDVEGVDLSLYLTQFSALVRTVDIERGVLTRQLIDFDILSQLDLEDIKNGKAAIEVQLAAIDKQVKKLASIYRLVHTLRKKEFSLEDLEDTRSRNLLPGNVLYKLLERYRYSQLLKELNRALEKAEGEIDKPKDVDIVQQALGLEEVMMSGAAGGYEVPLGAAPPTRKRRRRRKRKDTFI